MQSFQAVPAAEASAALGTDPGVGTDPALALETHWLPDGGFVQTGRLPGSLRWSPATFERVWAVHPPEPNRILVRGRWIPTPRWEQAYLRAYRYSGQINEPGTPPPEIWPLLEFVQTLDPRLNGVLLSWYDGALGHYIGPHRDDVRQLVSGAPILTLSFGESRRLRLSRHRGKGRLDLETVDGGLLILPWSTNREWTHQIVRSRRALGRRIAVTVRAFAS